MAYGVRSSDTYDMSILPHMTLAGAHIMILKSHWQAATTASASGTTQAGTGTDSYRHGYAVTGNFKLLL